MSHDHDHRSVKNLKLAFFLNLGFTLLEIFGGIYTNSIAIISDAIHDLGDSLSLGTAWYLQRKSQRKSDEKYHFGYRRFSLLGALINGLVLLLGSVYVIYAAINRFLVPEETDAQGMIFFAIIGIAVNGYAAWKLSKGKSLNERMVSWHLVEDVLGWVAILIVAVVLYFKDIPFLDPLLSILITSYILYNTAKRLKSTLFLFLQGKPKEIDQSTIVQSITALEGVQSIHAVQIWSLDGEHHVFNAHVKLEKLVDLDTIERTKKSIKKYLKEQSFEYITLEFESFDENCIASSE